jgi:hypothetical protein
MKFVSNKRGENGFSFVGGGIYRIPNKVIQLPNIDKVFEEQNIKLILPPINQSHYLREC